MREQTDIDASGPGPAELTRFRAIHRPRAAVVLAAGRSERLREVTGGGSKALVRLGGLALVERAIRTLAAAGLERIVVVVGYHAGPVAVVARRAAPRHVRIVIAEDWEEGNGASLAAAERALPDDASFVLLTADHVFSEGMLDVLLASDAAAALVDPAPDQGVLAEATRVRLDGQGRVTRFGKDVDSSIADCGAFLLGPSVFAAARRARARGRAALADALSELTTEEPLRAVALEPDAWWQDVDTPEDLARAGRRMRSALRRPGDGPVARFINRRLSIPVSWALAPLRPSPGLLSLLAFSCVAGAAVLLAQGEGVAGGALAQAGSVLDGVDGEVARLTLRAGPRGALLDGFLDRVSDAAVAAGLGVWALASGAGATAALTLTSAAVTGSLLSMATKDRLVAVGLSGPSERALGWLMGGRDARLLTVAVLAALGRPVAALAIVAATSIVSSALRVVGALRRDARRGA